MHIYIYIFTNLYIFINLSNPCVIVAPGSFHAQNGCARIENTSLKSVVTNVTRNGTCQTLKFVVHKWYHWLANLLWSLNSRPPPSKRTSYRPSDRLQTSWNWKLSQMLVASDGVAFVRTGLPTFCPCPNPSKPPSMSWIKIICNELTNHIPRPFGPCVYQRLLNF